MLDTCVIVAAVRSAKGASHMLVDLASEHNGLFETVLTDALAYEYEDVIYRSEQNAGLD